MSTVDEDDRIGRLERTVDFLVKRIEEISEPRQASPSATSSIGPVSVDPGLTVPLEEPSSAPLFVLRDVAAEAGVQAPQDEIATNTLKLRLKSRDIIASGLLTGQDASTLLSLFNEHYGRWVSFNPSTTPERLLAEVRGSPLLLSACCLIAIRHTTQDLASRIAPQLFREAKELLSAAMLAVPQPLDFFQASLIMSMWSTTISQMPLSVDSWLLSGFALQHALATNLFRPVTNTSDPSAARKRALDRLCIWNHLCLVHLHYSVGTRRKAMLDRQQIDRCRGVLDSDHATNFESRMVGEVHLYWIIYESCLAIPVDLPKTQAALWKWKEDWKFLFDQPRSQFIQMGFHFAQLIIYDQSLKTRSAAVRESLISEMVRLSTAIINLAMETTDDRTRHLTDHIYHMIAFAAVTLSRIMHLYESQLPASYNLVELDNLVLSLVSWLHSIGLPCHVAYTLGDVVASFHKKLRPNTQLSPTNSYEDADPFSQEDFASLFPELFGTESFEGSIGNLLPDWGPISYPSN
ncbi:hypothetical protein BU16DRAFT_548382 [Lophium mytilinum]|uniref:Transcription factor domain-containing protein n=1 Tax=Lophium mytilinum TaxID=390894 RepID=A0A6A6R308_9PEZI|nr:hypothetical protein BU16DRAFT_548382 [Lophium mytilinum]